MVPNGDCDGHAVFSGGCLVAMADGLLIMFGGWLVTVTVALSTQAKNETRCTVRGGGRQQPSLLMLWS